MCSFLLLFSRRHIIMLHTYVIFRRLLSFDHTLFRLTYFAWFRFHTCLNQSVISVVSHKNAWTHCVYFLGRSCYYIGGLFCSLCLTMYLSAALFMVAKRCKIALLCVEKSNRECWHFDFDTLGPPKPPNWEGFELGAIIWHCWNFGQTVAVEQNFVLRDILNSSLGFLCVAASSPKLEVRISHYVCLSGALAALVP